MHHPRYLPLIGANKLDAGIVIKFAGQELLLKYLSLLPLDKQSQLINSTKITFVKMFSDGSFETQFVDLESLHVRYFSQIFDNDIIRNEQQQKIYLTSKNIKQAIKAKKTSIRKLTYIEDKQVIKIGADEVKLSDIVNTIKLIDPDLLRSLGLSLNEVA